MLKKEQKTSKSIQEESPKETSGIKKIIKEILMKKSLRNSAALMIFIPTTANSGIPWCCS